MVLTHSSVVIYSAYDSFSCLYDDVKQSRYRPFRKLSLMDRGVMSGDDCIRREREKERELSREDCITKES